MVDFLDMLRHHHRHHGRSLVPGRSVGWIQLTGMTAVFTGATVPVVGVGAALELGKLSAVAWLGHRHGSASWALKASLTMLVAVLMALNAVGCFGYLSLALKRRSDE